MVLWRGGLLTQTCMYGITQTLTEGAARRPKSAFYLMELHTHCHMFFAGVLAIVQQSEKDHALPMLLTDSVHPVTCSQGVECPAPLSVSSSSE